MEQKKEEFIKIQRGVGIEGSAFGSTPPKEFLPFGCAVCSLQLSPRQTITNPPSSALSDPHPLKCKQYARFTSRRIAVSRRAAEHQI